MRLILTLTLLLTLLLGAGKIRKPIGEFGNQIIYTINYKLNSRFKRVVSKLYKMNRYKPLWIGKDKKISSVLNVLNNKLFNYKDKNFNRREIKELYFAIDSGTIPQENIIKAQARLDVMITDAFLQILHFVRVGDVDWRMVQRKLKSIKKSQDVRAVWEMKFKSMPPTKTIFSVIKKGKIEKYIRYQLPLEKRYRSLIKILSKYRKMPKFPKIHEGRKIKVGMSDDRVAQITKNVEIFRRLS